MESIAMVMRRLVGAHEKKIMKQKTSEQLSEALEEDTG